MTECVAALHCVALRFDGLCCCCLSSFVGALSLLELVLAARAMPGVSACVASARGRMVAGTTDGRPVTLPPDWLTGDRVWCFLPRHSGPSMHACLSSRCRMTLTRGQLTTGHQHQQRILHMCVSVSVCVCHHVVFIALAIAPATPQPVRWTQRSPRWPWARGCFSPPFSTASLPTSPSLPCASPCRSRGCQSRAPKSPAAP